jgi:hypothetical protein
MRSSMATVVRGSLAVLSVLPCAGAWVACSSSSGHGAGGSDASADVSSGMDTGTTTDASDGGAGEAAAAACTPQPVGTLPTWAPSMGYPMNVCSSAALTALITDCVGVTSDATKCMADRTTYAACNACVFTPLTASTLGPLVQLNDVVAVNYAGCLGTVGNVVPTACPPDLGVENECAWQACLGCTHPLSEGGVAGNDQAEFQACLVAAHDDGGPCLADYTAAGICFTTPEPPGVSNCIGPTTTAAAVAALELQVAAFLCGGAVSDAGTDAPAD